MLINSKTERFIWFCYFLLMLWFVSVRCFSFFYYGSEEHIYFSYLNAFNPLYLIPLFFNVMQILLSIVYLFVLLCVIFKIKVDPPELWKVLFFGRFIFDIVGNSYEIQYLSSLYQDKTWEFWIILSTIAGIYFPWYLASYFYAFQRPRLGLK